MKIILSLFLFVSIIFTGWSDEDPKFESSLWQIITYDSKYLIQDYGTSPPPRGVVVKNLENGEIIFSGIYYENINLRENTIEIVKFYGEYYNGTWSINKNLNEGEYNFALFFLEINQPPKEWVRIADLAQGNGLGLLIIVRYNFETKEETIIGGKYIKTM